MRKTLITVLLPVFSILLATCKNNKKDPSVAMIDAINLKKGNLILCGPPEQEFGLVDFTISCSDKTKKDFNLAAALLHSFEYDEAEKAFAKVIDEEPGCAMAYWGVAMSNYHPLWAPPLPDELQKGSKAIEIAKSLPSPSAKESEYIDAIGAFYKDYDKLDHHTRTLKFEEAMESIYKKYPGDKEAAIFYSLALVAAADPTDKTYSKQKKAGSILTALYPGQPDHPGIVHYIIHSYDYPGLAELALPAARKYASIAPSSSHAQHMPSHIFTRLGLWDECIQSNVVAASAAKCYGESTGLNGHWDEEMHALDYLVYGYLQKGDNSHAKEQLNYVHSIKEVHPTNFKVAYAFAAIPARYVLENRLWSDAAALQLYPAQLPWKKFQWQEGIYHFARLLGFVHTNKIDSAKWELNSLKTIHDTLANQKNMTEAYQVDVQSKAGEAWIAWKEGKSNEALQLMTTAANMEDATEKHPVTPGEVLPARELLGDMLMQMNQPEKALQAYEADLQRHYKRFNGLYGAGLAAETSGDLKKAKSYYQQLIAIADPNSGRPELNAAKLFLKNH